MTVAKKYADQTFTLSEYLALPENDRMEILEGMPYLLASPSVSHQQTAGAYEKGDKVPVQVLEGCTIDLDEIFSE